MEKTNEEYIHQILMDLKKLDYIQPEEIPNIDLYMDQITTFMDEHLKTTKRYPDDKLLTKTMINNYTKNNLLPPSNKKKYSKEHIILLIFIYYFKNIMSISDIQRIFGPLTEQFYDNHTEINLEQIYQEVFGMQEDQVNMLTKDIIRKIKKSKMTFTGIEDEEKRKFLTTFSFICMISFDVYVKKTVIERLIDSSILDRKKTKEKKKTDGKK